mmetsp:Transcript_24604/g.93013  ORF Transcript_24604/g.93013 Transcript_24604/m.93013 type:complete len:201 (-) Transcript_24604:4995-5597(-)
MSAPSSPRGCPQRWRPTPLPCGRRGWAGSSRGRMERTCQAWGRRRGAPWRRRPSAELRRQLPPRRWRPARPVGASPCAPARSQSAPAARAQGRPCALKPRAARGFARAWPTQSASGGCQAPRPRAAGARGSRQTRSWSAGAGLSQRAARQRPLRRVGGIWTSSPRAGPRSAQVPRPGAGSACRWKGRPWPPWRRCSRRRP